MQYIKNINMIDIKMSIHNFVDILINCVDIMC